MAHSRKSAAKLPPNEKPRDKKPTLSKPAPPPPRRYLVRCTFVGENQKIRVEGSFRFVGEASDTAALLPKLEKAVKKLRRTGELPRRCEVYVEFMLELTDLRPGLVVDFERWEREPRRFQHGCITSSETSPVFVDGLPSFRFGQPAEKGATATASTG